MVIRKNKIKLTVLAVISFCTFITMYVVTLEIQQQQNMVKELMKVEPNK